MVAVRYGFFRCSRSVRGCFLFIFTTVLLLFAYWNSQRFHSRIHGPRSTVVWLTQQPLIDLKSAVRVNETTVVFQPVPPCNENTFLAIVVSSAVSNLAARQTVRRTWGSVVKPLPNVRLNFLLGRSNDTKSQRLVKEESENYTDIIQEDFLDTYDNLTLKTVFLLKWIIQSCSQAQYVLKSDDDMFVNIENLLVFLQEAGHRLLLMGHLFEGASPDRNPHSKWFSPNTYSETSYPNYLSGTAYVFSGRVAEILYKTAVETTYFRLEDVFLTGICAKKAGLIPLNNPDFHYSHVIPDPCEYKRLISVHRMTVEELLWVWKEMQRKNLLCNVFPFNLINWIMKKISADDDD